MPSSPQAFRARVRLEGFEQVILSGCGAGIHHQAIFELKLHTRNVVSLNAGRNREFDVTIGAVFMRSGKNFAAGHVAFPVRVAPNPARNIQCDVRAVCLEPHGFGPRQAFDQFRLHGVNFLPCRDRIGPVQEHCPVNEGRELLKVHARILRETIGRKQRQAPAFTLSNFCGFEVGAAHSGLQARVGFGQGFGVAVGQDSQCGIGCVHLDCIYGGRLIELSVRGVRVKILELLRVRKPKNWVCATLQYRVVQGPHQRFGNGARGDHHALFGLHIQAVVGQERGPFANHWVFSHGSKLAPK